MENLPTLIKNIAAAKRIALVVSTAGFMDAFCAAIALQAKIGGMIFSSAAMPEMPFLANLPPLFAAMSNNDQLAIRVSSKTTEPKELRYEKTDNGLTIFITASSGQFNAEDVNVLPPAGNFDLVIIIGAVNFEQLGKIYIDNPKLFFNTPHINIDNNPANEFYGTMNIVNTTASSLSEVVMDIIEGLPGGLSGANSETIATALLAGITAQTSSFRDPKTTPSALQKASRLVAAGAHQKEIIQHLFKTKSLPLLQLWGRALARLTAQPDKQALTAVVTASDLQKTKMPDQSLPEVLRDIIDMVTGYSLVALLAEVGNNRIEVLLAGMPNEDLKMLAQQLQSGANTDVKPLVGQYQYVSIIVEGSALTEVQSRLAGLIETRGSVL